MQRVRAPPQNARSKALAAGDVWVEPAKAWLIGEAPAEELDDGAGATPSLPSQAVVAVGSAAIDARSGSPRTGLADDSLPMGRLVPSPKAAVGTAVESQQRVIQVSLGAEHGVLLTDAGIACTWGDNRYGQLGRSVCLKEEDGQAFPVLGLLTEEITQVAAGMHHCLALSATGLVWSWGRNKHGQLGCGDFRDKVTPEKVCKPPVGSETQGHQLGSGGKEDRIITIGAGAHSSIAASLNSNVYQWGDISTKFKEASRTHDKRKGAKVKTELVKRDRPHRVFSREDCRTQMRMGTELGSVSLSETACRVLDGELQQDKGRVKDLVESVRQLQEDIKKDRDKLSKMGFDKQKQQEESRKQFGDADNSDLGSLHDTIATLEREKLALERDIELYTKSLQSCDLQQAHNREQLQSLSQQATVLSERQDEFSLKLFMAKKGGAERKALEDKLAEAQEFMEANSNTRMTLLDQRAQTDKEKQRITHALNEQKKLRDGLVKRIDTVRDLSRSTVKTAGASDPLVSFLSEQCRDISSHFENKTPVHEFVAAMQRCESDHRFLDNVESRMKEMSETFSGQDPAQLLDMLQDLVDLRRSWTTLLEDKWLKDERDLSCFFDEAPKPAAPVGRGKQQLAALPDSPQLQLRDGAR